MPVRIQRKRTKGFKTPANTVYVGRPTKFGNPFNWKDGIAGDHGPRARTAAVILYREWLKSGRGPSAPTDADIATLRGKNLSCFCPLDQPCHASVLLELANQ